ncbi:MAG: serine hydrolase [Bacteroidota bacterium]
MRYLLIILILSLVSAPELKSQYYFPPADNSEWETASFGETGWDSTHTEELLNFLADNNSKGFIILHKGRLVMEEYFGEFTMDSLWYWASAGKTLTAFLTGLAQEQGYLSIDDPVSDHLGSGWTSMPEDKERQIRIKHQITMTTGLENEVEDEYCTEPQCLKYRTDPGKRWFYHNAPYTLTADVIESATGQNYNEYTREQFASLGFRGFWFMQGYNRLRLSTVREMAKFGLLCLSRGIWNGDTILRDRDYFQNMVNSSQQLNPSYGYLWWLNGKSGYKPPVIDYLIDGSMLPGAPDEMWCAMGKNEQRFYVIPGDDIVVVRMGDLAEGGFLDFDKGLWYILDKIIYGSVGIKVISKGSTDIIMENNQLFAKEQTQGDKLELYGLSGQLIKRSSGILSISGMPRGAYFLKISKQNGDIIRGKIMLY